MNTITIAIAFNHKRFLFGARWPKAKTLWQLVRRKINKITMSVAMVMIPTPMAV